jgi:cytochrome c peroxidase
MRWSSRAALGLAIVALLAADVARNAELLPPLSDEERDRIVAHGPWPAPMARDASNRASGNEAAIAFGRRMFHEPRLSANGYVACAACHQTDRGWTDAIPRARGLAPVDRNTPTLTNAAQYSWFGWSGASDSLWMASLRPLLDEREMGSSPAAVARVVRIGDGLACEYRRAFGRAPESMDDEVVMVDVAKAIAAFLETLTTGRTPFDEFREAIARGDSRQAERYPAAAARGARVFVGNGGCASCHSGATFTDGGFRTAGATDAGRSEGILSLLASPYSLAGRFNDDPAGTKARAESTRALKQQPTHRGQFRVPSLRNVAVTPPYLHDGSRETLREAVQHGGVTALPASDVDDLVAFLLTLTDDAGARRPVQRPAGSTCRESTADARDASSEGLTASRRAR